MKHRGNTISRSTFVLGDSYTHSLHINKNLYTLWGLSLNDLASYIKNNQRQIQEFPNNTKKQIKRFNEFEKQIRKNYSIKNIVLLFGQNDLHRDLYAEPGDDNIKTNNMKKKIIDNYNTLVNYIHRLRRRLGRVNIFILSIMPKFIYRNRNEYKRQGLESSYLYKYKEEKNYNFYDYLLQKNDLKDFIDRKSISGIKANSTWVSTNDTLHTIEGNDTFRREVNNVLDDVFTDEKKKAKFLDIEDIISRKYNDKKSQENYKYNVKLYKTYNIAKTGTINRKGNLMDDGDDHVSPWEFKIELQNSNKTKQFFPSKARGGNILDIIQNIDYANCIKFALVIMLCILLIFMVVITIVNIDSIVVSVKSVFTRDGSESYLT